PIFPGGCPPSIVGAGTFHDRVRDGNGWGHAARTAKHPGRSPLVAAPPPTYGHDAWRGLSFTNRATRRQPDQPDTPEPRQLAVALDGLQSPATSLLRLVSRGEGRRPRHLVRLGCSHRWPCTCRLSTSSSRWSLTSFE